MVEGRNRRESVKLTAAAFVGLAILIGTATSWDQARRRMATSRGHHAYMVAEAGADASSLGERWVVQVEGKPLIVEDYAAFPALGDLDGDGRPDLLLGDPHGFLKVYRNVGRPGWLRLAVPVRFGEFCDDERIPTG
jgi:hypothetical protein